MMSTLKQRGITLLLVVILSQSLAIVHAAIIITGVNPSEGDYGDTIVVEGIGVTAGVDANLYWDAVKSWDGEKGLLNSTEAAADGTFEVWFDVPEAVNGDHYLWVKDVDTGGTAMWGPFTVFARIKLDPSTALVGDEITIEGYGFSDEKEIISVTFDGDPIKTSPTTPETDELGSWTATFDVPTKPYGEYVVVAMDEEGVTATTEPKVGATIVLTPDEGPVGSVVEVEGRGFSADSYVVRITMAGITCYNTSEIEIDGYGEFMGEFVIPSVAEEDEYTVVVTDGVNFSATDDFEVIGLSSIEATPMYGAPGAEIAIGGYNFTAIEGEEVELVLVNPVTLEETPTPEEFETDEYGEFSGTFTVPALMDGDYTLLARQIDYMINATAEDFRVGLISVIVAPSKGPTGTIVLLAGVGFTGGETWNATMDGEAISQDEEDVNVDGTISHAFIVPTVDVGTYTITVMDIDTEIEVTTEFEVTHTTTMALDPAVAPNGYNVTIQGWHFADIEGEFLFFVLYNSTDDWDMDVKQGSPGVDAVTDKDGNFTAWWIVPELDKGIYKINVTDGEDLFAKGTFIVSARKCANWMRLWFVYEDGGVFGQYLGRSWVTDLEFDHNWGSDVIAYGLNDKIGFISFRMVIIPAGDWIFTVGGDDGVRLYIDGKLVIDGWKDQGYTIYQALQSFKFSRCHLLRLEWYENTGGAHVSFSIEPFQ